MYCQSCPIWLMQSVSMYPYYRTNEIPAPYMPPINRIIPKESFTTEEAMEIANQLGIDFSKFDVEQFRMGLDVELEHGRKCPFTNITDDAPLTTGKITLAHLNEFPDYYTRLTKLETEAEEYWSNHR